MRDVGASEARAALVLAALVGWSVLPDAPRSAPDCAVWAEASAVEVRAGEWWTELVACETDSERAPLRGPAPLLFGEKLDLNRVDASTLETLPGVGPVRAAAIVESRRDRPYESVAELERVHGIGPRTVAELTGWLQVPERTGHRDGHRRPSAGEGGP